MSSLAAPQVTNQQLTQEFEQIFREHSRFVYRTAYGVTGNAEDAEDVLQTIFLRLVRRELPPGLKKNPKAYLYRAAVNVSLSTLRSRRRRELIGDLDGFESSLHAAQARSASEVRDRLLATLETMAESDSAAVELLILRYVHNYSDADIGQMFGQSRGVVAVRLFRARNRLKKLMRESGEKR
jgi:RNA polymerase sigma-70 factor (ECF subfamily)